MRGGSAIKSMVQTHETTVTTVAEVAVSEGVLQLESVLLSKYHPFCNASGSVFHLTFGSTNLHWKRKWLFQNHQYTEGEIHMAIQFFNLILYTLIGTSVLG